MKRGLPQIKGKDHIYPFTSGLEVLKIFYELKIFHFKESSKNEYIQLINLIQNSVKYLT